MNIPPNRKGLISEADVNRLKEFAAYRQQIFADNRVKKGRNYWNATSVGSRYSTSKIIEKSGKVEWSVLMLSLRMQRQREFNILLLR